MLLSSAGREAGRLPSKLSLSRLSFRWQVGLLGTLVVVLSLAVLFAIVATLRYTKSAVLNGEKKRLAETARNLAQEYEDRADSARRNNQQPPLDNPDDGEFRRSAGADEPSCAAKSGRNWRRLLFAIGR